MDPNYPPSESGTSVPPQRDTALTGNGDISAFTALAGLLLGIALILAYVARKRSK